MYDLIMNLLKQNNSVEISGHSCLLISHLVWENTEIKSQFMKDEFCERLVEFCDFNELSNFADPEMPVEAL
jgi:hypothetical protein